MLDVEGEKAWTDVININDVERAVNTIIIIIIDDEAANFDFTTDIIIIVLCF